MSLPKGVSTGGWTSVRPGDRQGYLATGTNPDGTPWSMVQEYKDLGVTHIKLWVSWHELAQDLGRAPISFEEQAQFIDTTFGHSPYALTKPLIHYLDDAIKRANDEGVFVIVGPYQAAPTWSSGATGPEATGKVAEKKLPLQHTADSPFGWFIRYLIARYTGEVSEGPGSGCVTKTGNPRGARINAIEPINEPNYEWWPQTAGVPATAARDAMMTSEWWARFYTNNYTTGSAPLTLGPATADRTNVLMVGTPQTAFNTGEAVFTNEVLGQLQGWFTLAPVRWSHHNYHDIDDRRTASNSRVAGARVLVTWSDFQASRGDPTSSTYDPGRHDIYLTEGAARLSNYYAAQATQAATRKYRDGLQNDQVERLQLNLQQMKSLSYLRLWTQHALVEGNIAGDNPTYGFRDAGALPGAKRKSWATFKSFIP